MSEHRTKVSESIHFRRLESACRTCTRAIVRWIPSRDRERPAVACHHCAASIALANAERRAARVIH